MYLRDVTHEIHLLIIIVRLPRNSSYGSFLSVTQVLGTFILACIPRSQKYWVPFLYVRAIDRRVTSHHLATAFTFLQSLVNLLQLG